MSFVHLHLHTQYSLLDGACQIRKLFQRAKELDMPAVAMTDHGNLFGAINFYNAGKACGIKPIIGCEVYVAPKGHKDRSSTQKETAHLVLLAENNTGYANLIKLVSAGYLEGFYYKPRIDKELLAQHAEGLIGLSACLKGEVAQKLMAGKYDEAKIIARQYAAILGEGNFYIELMDHGIPEQKQVNEDLLRLAKELDLPLVATNDVHYLKQEHAEAHEALLAIQTQTTLNDPKRMRMYSNQFYLKSLSEMASLFAAVPEAIANTVKIADRCNVEFDFDTYHVPEFQTPLGESTEDYLKKLCLEGAKERFDDLTPEILERLDYELKVIFDLGFVGYFLIVWDFVAYAESQGIPVGPGRGSAAGSLVSYLLGITDLDPLKYELYFERFLNPERASMPDIDIDFCFERRAEVIDYVAKKYGQENVAQIITFGTMQAKAVIRDVARAMGLPYIEADRIAKLIPNELGIKLEDAIDSEPQLQELINEDDTVAKLMDMARALEGLTRHASIHAAGVVISDKPLLEYVPLYKSSDGQVTTAFTMKGIEQIGLLKMDFLGLKTLTLIQDCVRIIKETTGDEINIRTLPLDDKKTYAMLGRGESGGVFQLESSGMRDLLRRIKPSEMEDIISILALYRPGPMQSGMMDDFIKRKRGEEKVKYPHPALEPVLKNSYGVAIYQEQVMQMASVLAGFTMAEADNLRRAMSKKVVSIMQQMRSKFVEGCKKKNNIPSDDANRLFDLIDYFSGYGFNRSHSAAYAVVSYRTAWLKANYPVQFICALLTNERDNTDKLVEYKREANIMGIDVFPPNVNESFSDFTVTREDCVRYGLLGVKNIGSAAIDDIVQERKDNGSFHSIFDFCKRVNSRTANRKAVETLIRCGAMDGFGVKRSQMMAVVDQAVSAGSKHQHEQQVGQLSFFSMGEQKGGFDKVVEVYPDIQEWSQPQILSYEKELLGFYLSGHPLERYTAEIKTFTNATIGKLARMRQDQSVVLIAMIGRVKLTATKRTGERMAIIGLEDLEGDIEAVVFPRAFQQCGVNIKEGITVVIKGKVTLKEAEPKIFIDDVQDIGHIYHLIKTVNIDLDESQPEQMALVKKKLGRFPGGVPVHLRIKGKNHKSFEVKVGKELHVTPSEVLMDEIKFAVGDGACKFVI